MTERLISCAIVRNGVTESRGFKEHWKIRAALGDADPHTKRFRPDDTEGFLTDQGRFVTRAEAIPIGVASGQLNSRWAQASRLLLSSDINW